MTNVVVLPGHLPPVIDGEPVASIVESLEWYLEEAKRGQIIALAVAAVCPDGTPVPQISTTFQRASGTAAFLETAINKLKRRFETYLDEED